MDVRAQIATVIHLDRCLGCGRCAAACKASRARARGTEHMAWTHIEVRPGPGIPVRWDAPPLARGWEPARGGLRLRSGGVLRGIADLIFNAGLAEMDGQPEPRARNAADLLTAEASDDRPTARSVSAMTGAPIPPAVTPEGSAEDPLASGVAGLDRLASFPLPRTCNQCLKPACVAACPGAAIAKRLEDGVVAHGARCRGWRRCAAACPYSEVFVDWAEGWGRKCDLCVEALARDELPACIEQCPGRARYLGVLLVDHGRTAGLGQEPNGALVSALRDLVLDPEDDAVVRAARERGIADGVLEAARHSPAFKFVSWGLALPLHPEFRTFPMAFYVPPLLAPAAEDDESTEVRGNRPFEAIERARIPLHYLARLFAGGDPTPVREALRKMVATRALRRLETVGDIGEQDVESALAEAGLSRARAAELHRLTTAADLRERVVLPRPGAVIGEGSAKP